MKKLFVLGILIFFFNNPGFAKIWRVNNNPGVTADFTSAQQAHDAAVVIAGDTLYFEHSAASYGHLKLIKGLKLIGTGAYLSQNPGLQYNLNSSYLGDITLRPTAVNSLISVNCGGIVDSANNLQILRCRTGAISLVGASNCTVANCFFDGISLRAIFTSSPSCQIFGCTGISIYNNISTGSIQQEAVGYIPNQRGGCGSDWVMPHSVVLYNNSIAGPIRINGLCNNNICADIDTDGSTNVSNNIFYNIQNNCRRTAFLPGTNQSVSILESGNGNQFSVPSGNIYTSGMSAIDSSWHLKVGSPAIGAGTSGVDCGATGGGTPYLFGAQPAIPAIYKLNVAPAPTGNSIGVIISTRSNN